MYMIAEVSQYVAVASFAEAWIEIKSPSHSLSNDWSPPSRRRGLKSSVGLVRFTLSDGGRLLRGGVD